MLETWSFSYAGYGKFIITFSIYSNITSSRFMVFWKLHFLNIYRNISLRTRSLWTRSFFEVHCHKIEAQNFSVWFIFESARSSFDRGELLEDIVDAVSVLLLVRVSVLSASLFCAINKCMFFIVNLSKPSCSVSTEILSEAQLFQLTF